MHEISQETIKNRSIITRLFVAGFMTMYQWQIRCPRLYVLQDYRPLMMAYTNAEQQTDMERRCQAKRR